MDCKTFHVERRTAAISLLISMLMILVFYGHWRAACSVLAKVCLSFFVAFTHIIWQLSSCKRIRVLNTSLVKSGVRYFLHHLTTANALPILLTIVLMCFDQNILLSRVMPNNLVSFTCWMGVLFIKSLSSGSPFFLFKDPLSDNI